MKFRLVIDTDKEEEVVVTAHAPSTLTDEIQSLVLNRSADRIPGYTEDNIKMLSFSKIECVTVLEGKTYAIDENNNRYRLKLRLYELEGMLPQCFIRINKSTLANEQRLDRFMVTYAGSVDAIFKCGYREYVSRRCFSEIKRRLEKK